jgi:hypothetical protein
VHRVPTVDEAGFPCDDVSFYELNIDASYLGHSYAQGGHAVLAKAESICRLGEGSLDPADVRVRQRIIPEDELQARLTIEAAYDKDAASLSWQFHRDCPRGILVVDLLPGAEALSPAASGREP